MSNEKKNYTNPYKNKYRTGEDIDMLRENNYERKNYQYRERNICDTHEDGA